MGDMGEDFADYMDNLAASEKAASQRQAMYDAHENWRQNTWGGWAVRQIQTLARHFRPFLDDVREVLAAPEDDSLTKVIVFNLIRMLAIFTVVGGVYALGNIFQSFIGKELVQEEEIVIVHEYATEEEAARARAEQEKKDKKRQ
mmetsp:Transcript_5611/g.8423  ORF Transcript_5611/g.8423 Transcript_5611/m.8423 type:complete len:144 (+) Transcript_5611:150-581(+)|eukprot:CAMPEP_0117023662 /NCGR_PEP_ID=MMETSP0472-20121206/17640_1 /TAXON_ID=693140 ORGANISM="Tiarina fusus, Strain LIS" /NCGR_SAMPLE_ID=MMETSP0472 /ASSEMBLY_ACC=CAM_ASM_000603 /LENGTH=143 /DNA_ID=CAMNT_0004729851 /DNA_START=137 /DNA_END=568 /DNA_ORIENTATION=+